MAKKQVQENVENFNEDFQGETFETVEEQNTSGNKRERRVTTVIKLPEEGSTVGVLEISVVGLDEPKVVSIDFATAPVDFIRAAALTGLQSKIASQYAGVKDAAEIAIIIDESAASFAEGHFVTRSLGEKVPAIHETVLAWIRAVEQDETDPAVVAKYVEAWNSRSREEKTKVSINPKVVAQLKLIAEAKLERRANKIGATAELEVL